jgi:anti-anti-sigma factor
MLHPPPHTADASERLTGPGLSCFRLPGPAGPDRLMLVGELDLATADRARTAIRRAQDETPELSCDLGDVWFVDLSGLQVLLSAALHAKLTGGRLTVTNCPSIVPRMLRLLMLEDALEIQPRPRSAGPSRGCAPLRRHVS